MPSLLERLVPCSDRRGAASETVRQHFPAEVFFATVAVRCRGECDVRGWNVNGQLDPRREVTVSADGLNKANTTTNSIYENDGFHISDLRAENCIVDETVYAVQMAGLEYMKTWLA